MTEVRPLDQRIAGAPISWGVCEVPGWGFQLGADTVLTQMREVGIAATEYGPDGFLPDDPTAKADLLARYELQAVGQFVPVVLHDPSVDPMPTVQEAMTGLIATNAMVVVIAAATGVDGYDDRPVLDDEGWATLLGHLDEITDAAAARGLTATVHPHVGTMIETGDEVARVLAGSRIKLCLDTGHLLIGGGDPAAVVRDHADRIGHMHLKDVRVDLAAKVGSGELSYTDAVREGIYVPLGQGDVDIAGIIGRLEQAGYDGWYVMEQDTILAAAPDEGGADPLDDIRSSIDFLLASAKA
ncbi:TIM barrel protein [Aestuariimicrobium ganziense]|uniref:TIM barrel protein n=1 Tax=Aestuariimicrobium ganziense TaxID=2773677 RepID=UPI001943A19C|nr:TIM barrel protein [Aestuariimicrobium ganziense]